MLDGTTVLLWVGQKVTLLSVYHQISFSATALSARLPFFVFSAHNSEAIVRKIGASGAIR